MTLGTTLSHEHFSVDPRTHTAIFGKTGTGKSVLLEHMALQTIEAGEGIAVLDPHGELIDRITSQIPRKRIRDVIYFDPTQERVPGINILQVNGHTSQIVSSLTNIIKNIWPENWGPRSEWLLENLAFALLSTDYPISLLSLYKLLAENDFKEKTPNYRRRVSEDLQDPALIKFFRTYEHWTKTFREEVVTPLLNKVNKLALNPYLRDVIGQPTSSFNFREAIDTRKIILCKLPKGTIGDDVSSLLGSIIVTKIALAALSREDTADRQPFTLLADEIQNFIHGVDFPTILSEARKYGLKLVVATQTTAQVPEKSRASIFGNCSTLVSFRVSGEDADILAKELSLDLRPTVLQDLPNYQCRARTMRGRFPTNAELIETYPPNEGSQKRKEKIIKVSQLRYGRPRHKVEARIRRHLLS
jgi:energy-coupling factor transporter ATP-binding protein EcfA2